MILAALALGATAAQAQSADEPTLVFSISAGMTAGGDLWTLNQQPQPAPGGFDTLALGRVLRPGLVAGLSATYQKAAHFGFTGEVTYFGIASEQRCQGPPTFLPDTANNNINEAACTDANGKHVATSVVGFLVGGIYQFLPGKTVQPFLRATAGPGLMGNSYIQTTGTVHSPACATADNICELAILDESGTQQFTFVANLSAGATIRMAPGYRLRFEVHDVVTQLPVVTGPKSGASIYPQTGREIKHVPTITFGLDVLLERRHSRRY
jgi:hypothetical protein